MTQAQTSLLVLEDTLTALGRNAHQPRAWRRLRGETVPLHAVVGTLARRGEFDRSFRPLSDHTTDRWERAARAVASGDPMPPVSLVRVGELYFVDDGHHRVSAARAHGVLAVDAHVRAICTVAFGEACLTPVDLVIKAAERDFLAVVPLPDPALRDLWLEDPTDYRSLAMLARRWSDRCRLTAPGNARCHIDTAVAAAWWTRDVLPRARGATARPGGCRPPSIAAAYLDRMRGTRDQPRRPS